MKSPAPLKINNVLESRLYVWVIIVILIIGLVHLNDEVMENRNNGNRNHDDLAQRQDVMRKEIHELRGEIDQLRLLLSQK